MTRKLYYCLKLQDRRELAEFYERAFALPFTPPPDDWEPGVFVERSWESQHRWAKQRVNEVLIADGRATWTK